MKLGSSPTRRRFLEFLIAVVVLHGVAIALYYALGVPRQPMARQRMFGWVWIGATALVIFVGLSRVKRARRLRSVSTER